MKNYLDPRIWCVLFALWSYGAAAAFYPINRGMVNNPTYVTTSGGTTTAIATGNQIYIFEGSSAQTFKLPPATALPIDWWYDAINNSTGSVAVQDNGGGAIGTVGAGDIGRIFMKGRPNAAGTWKINTNVSPNTLLSYYAKAEFIDNFTGAVAPVKTNGAGYVDATLIPTLNQSTTGNSATATSLAASPTQCSVGFHAIGIAASGNANCIADGASTSADVTLGTGLSFGSGTGVSSVLQAFQIGIASGYYLPTTTDQTNWNSSAQSIGAFGAAPAAKGLDLTSNVLTLEPADGTHPGAITTGAQTIAGAKTFSSTIVGSVNGNAATVTTNANLTGPITSSGNATTVAAQTGTGSTFVMDTAPTLVTPVLGVASATSINKVAITAPATSSTLTIANGKTLTSSNTLTLAGTDGSTLNVGAGGTLGTLAFLSDPLAVNKGGTGLATLTAHSLQVGNGASSPTQIAVPASGTILTGVASSDPVFSATPTLGVATATKGTLSFAGNTSGTVTIQPAAAAGTWSLTLPTTAGSNTNVLQTDGNGVTSWVASSSTAPRSRFRATPTGTVGGSSSGDSVIANFGTPIINTGSNISYTGRTTTTADFFTVNADGIYSVTFTAYATAGAPDYGVTLNDTQTSTSLDSMSTAAQILCSFNTSSANGQGSCSWTGFLSNGDVVRAKAGSNISSSASRCQFSMAQVNN